MPENHCGECGALLRAEGEYHPYPFCVLQKAGLNPWREVQAIAADLRLGEVPPSPPLVKHLDLLPRGA